MVLLLSVYNFDFYLYIDKILNINYLHFINETSFFPLFVSNSISSINITTLVCFIPILVLIVIGIAMSELPETIDPKLLELKPVAEPVHREKETKKDNPHSDIVWTRLSKEDRTYTFIYDQDNVNGITLIGFLGRNDSRVEINTVNGIQYVGIICGMQQGSRTLPYDQIKRACNKSFYELGQVDITSRRERLIFHPRSVILKRLD